MLFLPKNSLYNSITATFILLFLNSTVSVASQVVSKQLISSKQNHISAQHETFVRSVDSVVLVPTKSLLTPPPEIKTNWLVLGSQQNPACNNVDFETGDFTGWTGSVGYNGNSNNPLTISTPGITSSGIDASETSCSYQTIVTGNTDPHGLFPMLDPGGGKYAVRIGGENINRHGYGCPGNSFSNSNGEILQQTFNVTTSNALFNYNYAVVLNDGGHPDGEQPYFRAEVLDQNGNIIPCLQYYVQIVAHVKPPGFKNSPVDSGVYYLPWASNSINLSSYLGQTITIRFTAAGCTLGGHYGYGYIDGSCSALQIINSSLFLCKNSTMTLTAPAGAQSYVWGTLPPGGTGIVGSPNQQTITVNKTGRYQVTITNSNGCSYQIDTTVVQSPPITPDFSYIARCPGLPSTFKDLSICTSQIVKWNWDFGDGQNSALQNPGHIYATQGNYNVRLIVTNAGGCSDTINKPITISNVLIGDGGPNKSICFGNSTVIGVSNQPGFIYKWSPGKSLSDSTNGAPTASPTVTTTYILKVGCVGAPLCNGTDTVIVFVNPLPVISAGVNTIICPGYKYKLTPTLNPGYNYQWTPPGSLDFTNIAQPTASPTANTTYKVTITDGNFCSATSSVVISVYTVPPANAGPGKAICFGNNTLIGTSSVPGYNYSWSPTIGLNNASIAQPIASPTANTVYSITVTDNTTGCTSSSQVLVTVNPLPVADAGPDATTCYGGTVTLGSTICTGCSYSWSPNAYLNNPSNDHPIFTAPAVSGTYKYILTVTNAGCSKTDSAVVMVIPPPTTFAGPTQTTCAGSPITIGFSNNPNHTYSWSPTVSLDHPNNALPVATPTVTTTYTVTATDRFSGCSVTSSVVVNVNKTVVLPGANATICPGFHTQLGALPKANYQYRWHPGASLNDSTLSNPIAYPFVTTTYTLIADDTLITCPASAQVVITVSPLPVVNVGIKIQSICRNGSVHLGNSPPDPNLRYQWSPGLGLNNPLSSNPTASPSVSTTYILQVQDKTTNCFNSDQAIVNVLSTPVAKAGRDTAICVGSSVMIGQVPVPGISYKWHPASGLNNSNVSMPLASPTAPSNTYVLVATDLITSCKDSDAVVVNINQPPVAFAGVTGTVCLGGLITLGSPAIANCSYQWAPATGLNSSIIAQPSVTVTAPVIYSVTVTNNITSCFGTAQVSLFVVPRPVAYAGKDITICAGSPVPIGIAPAPGVTYTWSPSSGLSDAKISNPIASPSVTTTYTVTASVGNCIDVDAVVISVNNAIANVGPSPATLCPGQSVLIGSPALPNYQYSWNPLTGLDNPNIAQPTASPIITTTYTLTATDKSTGCVSSNALVVNVSTIASAGVIPNTGICSGASVSLGLPGNNPAFNYNWNPSSVSGSNPSVSPPSPTTYAVTVTDPASGCSTSASVVINVYASPTPPGGSFVICKGESVKIGNGTTGTYQWQPSSGLDNAAISSPTASPSVNTTYTVTITSSSGCTNTGSVPVRVALSTALVTPTYVPICVGSATTLTASGGIAYAWSPATALNNTSIPNPLANPLVTTTYTVTITDVNSNGNTCSVSIPVIVDVSSTVLNIIPGFVDTICAGDMAKLFVHSNSKNTQYKWANNSAFALPLLNNNSTDSVLIVSPSVTTTYYVQAANTYCNGPTATPIIPMVVNVQSVNFALNPIFICPGVSGTPSISSPSNNNLKYHWYPNNYIIGADSGASITVSPPSSMVYYAEAKNPRGCKLMLPCQVTVGGTNASINANKTEIFEGEQVQLSAEPVSSAYTYQWNPSVGLNPATGSVVMASPSVSTTYKVKINNPSNSLQCIGEASVHITVDRKGECDPEEVFVPNTFTPNGDGHNDVLYVRSPLITDIQFVIFNRWGEKMAEITNLKDGWDGQHNGKPAESGVYAYYVKYRCITDGKEYMKKGNVTIMK